MRQSRPRAGRLASVPLWNAGHASAAAGRSILLNAMSVGFSSSAGIVGRELVADHLEVPARIAAGAVDDLDEHARPLDVAQERVPEAGAGAGALDQAGHVGDGRAPEVGVDPALAREVHHAQVRLERGERVVGDLGRRRGERREQRRLPGVRQPDEPDVGDEPQLQPDPALLARLALLGVARRLVRRRREVDVAEAASAAARGHDGLSDRDEVGDQLAGRVVEHGRARRDVEDEVVAGRPVPARALAPPPAGARKWCLYWKSRSVVWPASTRR